MSYREVQDGRGRMWQVWDTVPTIKAAGALAEGYSSGWLTFECDDEKRRLVPVPHGWDVADDARVLSWLNGADPVHRLNRAQRAERDDTARTGTG
ncbi:MAG: hypothetical protein JWM27_2223 [Gemmatimonadetes bacterium]|nr:hypothetical protein [Gemmatimonadota bacterium]